MAQETQNRTAQNRTQLLLEKTAVSIRLGNLDPSRMIAEQTIVDLLKQKYGNGALIAREVTEIGISQLDWGENEVLPYFEHFERNNDMGQFSHVEYLHWFEILSNPKIASLEWARQKREEIISWWQEHKQATPPTELSCINLLFAKCMNELDPTNADIPLLIEESITLLSGIKVTYPIDISLAHPYLDQDEMYCPDRLFSLTQALSLLREFVKPEEFQKIHSQYIDILKDDRILFLPENLLNNLLHIMQLSQDKLSAAALAQHVYEIIEKSGRHSQDTVAEILVNILPTLVQSPEHFPVVQTHLYSLVHSDSRQRTDAIGKLIESVLILEPAKQDVYLSLARKYCTELLRSLPKNDEYDKNWIFIGWVGSYRNILTRTPSQLPVPESNEVLTGIEVGAFDFAIKEIPEMIDSLLARKQTIYARKLYIILLKRMVSIISDPSESSVSIEIQKILINRPEYLYDLIELTAQSKTKKLLM